MIKIEKMTKSIKSRRDMRKHRIIKADSSIMSSNNMRVAAKIFFLLLITAFLSYSALAIGISPSIREVYFEPGMEKTLSYHVINNENKNISVSLEVIGDLKEYITLHDSIVYLPDTEEKRQLYYTLNFPKNLDLGIWDAEIMATSALPDSDISSQKNSAISATISVASKVSVIAASPDNYLLAELDAADAQIGGNIGFDIALKNLGHDDLQQVYAGINIYSSQGKLIAGFNTAKKDIRKYSMSHILASLPFNAAKGMIPGRYSATAIIYYDNLTAETEDVFKLGNPRITINEISLSKVDNNTYRFDIDALNEWNTKIKESYIVIDIKDKTGSIAQPLRSYLFDMMPFENKSIILYAKFDEEQLNDARAHVITVAEGNTFESIYFVEDILKSKTEKILDEIKEALTSPWFRIMLLLIIMAVIVLHILSLYNRHNKKKDQKKKKMQL